MFLAPGLNQPAIGTHQENSGTARGIEDGHIWGYDFLTQRFFEDEIGQEQWRIIRTQCPAIFNEGIVDITNQLNRDILKIVGP